MTGKWKKAAAVLLAAVMAVLLVPLPTYAKETAKISVGSGSCDIGDEVTISVSVSSSVDIYMCDIWLSYDSGVLQPRTDCFRCRRSALSVFTRRHCKCGGISDRASADCPKFWQGGSTKSLPF